MTPCSQILEASVILLSLFCQRFLCQKKLVLKTKSGLATWCLGLRILERNGFMKHCDDFTYFKPCHSSSQCHYNVKKAPTWTVTEEIKNSGQDVILSAADKKLNVWRDPGSKDLGNVSWMGLLSHYKAQCSKHGRTGSATDHSQLSK